MHISSVHLPSVEYRAYRVGSSLWATSFSIIVFKEAGSPRLRNSIGVEVFFPFGASRTALRNILEKIVTDPES